MAIAEIEDKLLETIGALGLFATLQSAGRKDVPEVYAYPACFVYFDGDKDTGNVPRPIDEVEFAVIIQMRNLSSEQQAARDVYTVNDLVRDAIRCKTLGLANIDAFACVSRKCTGYDDSEGAIEYTHSYRARIYGAVVTE